MQHTEIPKFSHMMQARVYRLLVEIAELGDDTVDLGDPALLGSIRDDARMIVAKLDKQK